LFWKSARLSVRTGAGGRKCFRGPADHVSVNGAEADRLCTGRSCASLVIIPPAKPAAFVPSMLVAGGYGGHPRKKNPIPAVSGVLHFRFFSRLGAPAFEARAVFALDNETAVTPFGAGVKFGFGCKHKQKNARADRLNGEAFWPLIRRSSLAKQRGSGFGP